MRAEVRPRRTIVSLAATIVAAMGLAGCGFLGFDHWRWNQKMTIVVETPSGPVTGASVVRIDVSQKPRIFHESRGIVRSLDGEAVTIELAQGQYLFALLGEEAGRARGAFAPDMQREKPDRVYGTLEDLRESRDLQLPLYPRLVTFDDIADPSTVRQIDPGDLSASFGSGYRLQSITLEITDEPITQGRVEQVLGWLNDVWPNRLDGDRFGNTRAPNQLANSLSANSFSTKIGQ